MVHRIIRPFRPRASRDVPDSKQQDLCECLHVLHECRLVLTPALLIQVAHHLAVSDPVSRLVLSIDASDTLYTTSIPQPACIPITWLVLPVDTPCTRLPLVLLDSPMLAVLSDHIDPTRSS